MGKRSFNAKSLGPVPSTGPGERLRTTLFVATPPFQKRAGRNARSCWYTLKTSAWDSGGWKNTAACATGLLVEGDGAISKAIALNAFNQV
jgi:hypothetical protein